MSKNEAAKRKRRTAKGSAIAQNDGGATLDRYVLMLYVLDMTPRSANAIANIKRICEDRLRGRYDLEVVDVTEGEHLREDRIVAVPTLVKKAPLPERWMIGDLSDREKVLRGLDLIAAGG